VHHGAADIAATHGDEAFVLEDAQRLADRRRAHLELLGQAVERRQLGAVLEVAVDDPLAQAVRDQLGQAGLSQLSHVRSSPRGRDPTGGGFGASCTR